MLLQISEWGNIIQCRLTLEDNPLGFVFTIGNIIPFYSELFSIMSTAGFNPPIAKTEYSLNGIFSRSNNPSHHGWISILV